MKIKLIFGSQFQTLPSVLSQSHCLAHGHTSGDVGKTNLLRHNQEGRERKRRAKGLGS